jgi:hypothetical protein
MKRFLPMLGLAIIIFIILALGHLSGISWGEGK